MTTTTTTNTLAQQRADDAAFYRAEIEEGEALLAAAREAGDRKRINAFESVLQYMRLDMEAAEADAIYYASKGL